jgi:hypothetical protein
MNARLSWLLSDCQSIPLIYDWWPIKWIANANLLNGKISLAIITRSARSYKIIHTRFPSPAPWNYMIGNWPGDMDDCMARKIGGAFCEAGRIERCNECAYEILAQESITTVATPIAISPKHGILKLCR